MRVNRENIGKHLLEYQLGMIGKDLMVIVDDDHWRFNNTLTYQQYLDFRNYCRKKIQKVFKCNAEKRDLIFYQFWEMFGLRIKN